MKKALTFAGDNVYHKNGLAEKIIRDLQNLTRKNLMIATTKWKDPIAYNLGPCVLRLSNDSLNNTSSLQDKERRKPEKNLQI